MNLKTVNQIICSQKNSKNAARILSAFLSVVLLCGVICTALPLSSLPSSANTSDIIEELEKTVEELQAEIEKAKESIAGLESANSWGVSLLASKKAEETTLKAALSLYSGRLQEAEAQINSTKDNITYCENAIKRYDQKLLDLKKENEALYENYKLTLRALRERQDMTLLEMLFNAKSISEFLSYVERARDLAEYKRKTLNKIEESFKELTARQENAVEELNRHKELLDTFTKMRDSFARQIEETEDTLTKLAAEIIKTEGWIVDLEDSTKKAQEELDKLIADQEAAANALLAEEQKLALAKQTMLWPVDYKNHRITSKYGYRYHPISGKYTFHTGVDICGPQSGDIMHDNIYAAMGGTVITAVVSRGSTGYGTYVIISHGYNNNYGGTVSTLYAHCEEIYVKEGQVVEQGQKIGIVGTTGASTGYHLHYEVRLNGKTADPLAYNYITEPGGAVRDPMDFITKAW